jgi:hypothetical protein
MFARSLHDVIKEREEEGDKEGDERRRDMIGLLIEVLRTLSAFVVIIRCFSLSLPLPSHSHSLCSLSLLSLSLSPLSSLALFLSAGAWPRE